jgi:hypothetical protein
MMRALPAILANTILFAAAVGYGSALLRLLPQSFSRLDRFALVLLGGLGLLGTLLFDVGQVWFSRTAIVAILLPGVVTGLLTIIRTVTKLRESRPKIGAPLLPALVVSAVILISAVGGLAEPVGDIRMDTIAYHYLGPKVWLRNGVIRPAIDEALTAFPAVVETCYAALMSMGGQRAPGFSAVVSLLGILLVTAALARRSGLDSLATWWVLALIISMPALYRGAYGGFVDVLYSGFVLAAARIGFDAQKSSHYLVFGMFCGFAMGTKYLGLIVVVLLLACTIFLASRIHKHDNKAILKHASIACGAAGMVAAPWYLRNWILLGSPIYPPPPFLLRFFEARHFPSDSLEGLSLKMHREARGMGRDLRSLMLLPFHLTYNSANFVNGTGGIGLAPLAFGPFGLLGCAKDWFVKALAFFALLQALVWFFTMQEARYIIHVYVIATILAVWGWKYVLRVSSRVGSSLSAVIVGCSILYGLFFIISSRVEDMHAAVSTTFESKRRAESVPFSESFQYLNQDPSVKKVLISDPLVPAYYLDKDYLKPTGRFGEQVLPESTNLDKIFSELRPLRISHVLDVRREPGAFRVPPGREGFTLVFQREDQRVYRVD